MIAHNNIALRKITYRDTELIVRWRNSDIVKKNLFTQNELTKEQHMWWMKNKVDAGECVQFIIETIDSHKAVGTVFIKNIDEVIRLLFEIIRVFVVTVNSLHGVGAVDWHDQIWDQKMEQQEEKERQKGSKKLQKTRSEVSDWAQQMASFKPPKRPPNQGSKSD